MMRKRFLILAAVAAFLLAGSMASAQMMGDAPMAAGACCNSGVPSVPSGQQCLLLHQVGPGENLHILAAYYYGDARAWRRIYELNKKTIKNPNMVRAGQVLKIEIPACWTPRFDLQEFLRLEKRREDLMKRAPGEKPMEYRSKETIQSTLPQITIEEGGEEAGGTEGGEGGEKPPTIVPGVGPIPEVTTPPPTAPAGGEEGPSDEGGGGD